MINLSFTERCKVSAESLFAWHRRPGAFLRLNPPYEPVHMISHHGGIYDGAVVKIKIPIVGSIGIPWTLTHKNYIENIQFEDHQLSGPFKTWKHVHRFKAEQGDQSTLKDDVSFSLPGSFLSEPLIGWIFERKLTRLFAYRHRITKTDLEVIQKYADRFPTPQKFLLSGASGFIGTTLAAFLTCAGHEVSVLVRHRNKPESDKKNLNLPENVTQIFWDPYANQIDIKKLEGFDHVIHLSGENIAKRWTQSFKEKIITSRTVPTKVLCTALLQLTHKPKTFISASGIGFYGIDSQGICDEESPLGKGFLAHVVKDWEKAASDILAHSDIRLVHARFGAVISPEGGALNKLRLPFTFGVGGPVGDGQNFMSMIAKDDVVYGLYHIIANKAVSGPVNFCLPKTETNQQFSKTLSNVLNRPCVFRIPKTVIKILFGQMGEETVLASQNSVPKKLIESGFKFSYPTSQACLKHCLGK